MAADADGWVAEAAGRQRVALLPPPQPWGVGLHVAGPGRGAVPPFSEAERRAGTARPELGAALSAVVSRLINTLMMTDSKHMVVSGGDREDQRRGGGGVGGAKGLDSVQNYGTVKWISVDWGFVRPLDSSSGVIVT